MAWNTKSTNNNLSYVDNKTKELMADRPDIEARVNAARATADDLMTKLQDAGLTTYRDGDDGKQLLNRAAISVTPSKDDGKTLFTKLTIDDDGNKFVANLGADGAITSIQAEKWNNSMRKTETYKGADAIANSPFKSSVKNIADFVEQNGLVAEKGGISSFEQFTRDANKSFKETRPTKPLTDKETGEPVIDEKTGENVMIADTWVKYAGANDGGYERAYIRSTELPNIAIELGVQPDGTHYAKAINEALCADGETPRDPSAKYSEEPPATAYVNRKSDLDKLDASILDKVPELGDVIEQHKARENEQGKEQKKAKKQDDYER